MSGIDYNTANTSLSVSSVWGGGYIGGPVYTDQLYKPYDTKLTMTPTFTLGRIVINEKGYFPNSQSDTVKKLKEEEDK